MNLAWGSPLSLAGGSSKTHRLPGTLRPCVLCWGPLVHGDIILRQSINSLWPDIAARCPLPDSLPASPLPPALWPLFPLGREEGAARGAQPSLHRQVSKSLAVVFATHGTFQRLEFPHRSHSTNQSGDLISAAQSSGRTKGKKKTVTVEAVSNEAAALPRLQQRQRKQ